MAFFLPRTWKLGMAGEDSFELSLERIFSCIWSNDPWEARMNQMQSRLARQTQTTRSTQGHKPKSYECALNTCLFLTKTWGVLPLFIRKRGEVFLFDSEMNWLHRELEEVTRCWNREFACPWWSSAADVLTRVALKLSTHQLMRLDVWRRVKKVWRRSAVCGMSYGLWRDRWGSHHGRIVFVVECESVGCGRWGWGQDSPIDN